MGRKLSYGMAINEALHQMMGADERVFILRGSCVRVKASTGNHVCRLFRGLL